MNDVIVFLIHRLSQLGQIPMCNGIAERAPHIFGYCFPLCYRCTFLFIMFAVTLLVCYKKQIRIHFVILLLCILPMIIDGSLQTFIGIMSDNLRRAVTGAFFGLGIGAFVARIYLYVDDYCQVPLMLKK